jgi:Domain of unknown function (DUF4399)
MRMFAIAAALVLAASVGAVHAQDRTPAPKGAKVFFVGLKDGATVSNPVTVKFGIKGMTLAPAGTATPNTGHHHLFIDTDVPADLSKPIPAIPDKVVHFGKAQTETILTLSPGKHTLQLLLGDQNHIAHNPPVISKKITITVSQ